MRGFSWPPNGPFTPGDALDTGRVDARRHRRLSPVAVSHHYGVLIPPLAAARGAPDTTAPPGTYHYNAFLAITATIVLSTELRQQFWVIWNQVVAEHGVTGGRQGAIADPRIEPVAMHP